MRRNTLLVINSVLALGLAIRADALIYEPNDLIVATSLSPGSVPTILAVDPETGSFTPIAEGGLLASAYGVAIDLNGDILVVSSVALTGRVIRIDGTTGEQSIVVDAGEVPRPFSLGYTSPARLGTRLYVPFNGSGVVVVDLEAGSASVLTEDGFISSSAQSVTVESSSSLLVGGSTLVRVALPSGRQSLVGCCNNQTLSDVVMVDGIPVALGDSSGLFEIDPLLGTNLLNNLPGQGVERLANGDFVLLANGDFYRWNESLLVPVLLGPPLVGYSIHGFVAVPPPSAACANGEDDDGDGLVDFPADPGCRFASFPTEAPACDDGIDNDGDGLKDSADPQCLNPSDRSEKVDCGDGVDNDGDGLVDTDDPGCHDLSGPLEDPACSDGVDNDTDGFIDFDGAQMGLPDPECDSAPYRNSEAVPEAIASLSGLVAVTSLALLRRRWGRPSHSRIRYAVASAPRGCTDRPVPRSCAQ